MFRKWIVLIGLLFMQGLHAESLKTNSCDSNSIMYDWEKSYGSSDKVDRSGHDLFRYAIDQMFRYAKTENDDCLDAYSLVVDKLLTETMGNKSKAFNDRDYLVEKLEELLQKKPETVDKITNRNPEINQLWGDYQLYLSQKDQLADEYKHLASSIIQDFCQGHYDEEKDSSDYDSYMDQCEKEWQQ